MPNRNEIFLATPKWGIGFARPAVYAGGLPFQTMPVPRQLIVPLQQSAGQAAQAIVQPGDTVLKGQPLGKISTGALGAIVHAPTSGMITTIAQHPVPGYDESQCVFIDADGADTAWPGNAIIAAPLQADPQELLAMVTAAGIVGLGGAAFPTDRKLHPDTATPIQIKTLLLNGVECEPRINCDDALMSHHAADMLLGAQLMLRMTGATECIIAIKVDAVVALDVVRAATARLGDKRFRIVLVPPVYPAGGEAQLIQLLTGQEVPAGGLPQDIGLLCQNVATVAALGRYITTGEPLISRIVTVTGRALNQPQNLRVRIGTPIKDVISFVGGYTTERVRLSMGGPMMGTPLMDDSLPVTKGCNCLLVEPSSTAEAAPLPCIRCGDCATVCPVALTPQLLLQVERTNDFDQLETLGLNQCIECGCCDYVCPSQIPLTQIFVNAKQTAADIQLASERAQQAEVRFVARNERLERQAREPEESFDTSDNTSRKATLARLLERVSGKQDNE